MSLKNLSIIILGMINSMIVMAMPPVEVLSSCKNEKAINAPVIMTKLKTPGGANDPQCDDHYQRREGDITYGMITCQHEPYLIVNESRLKLSSAKNYSVNPSIKPGAPISIISNWSSIKFANQSYLCINDPLSESGQGATRTQYYIIENITSGTPVVNYYFFDKDIMPLTSTD